MGWPANVQNHVIFPVDGVADSAITIPPGEGLVAGYYFNDGDTMEEVINGFSWVTTSNTIEAPPGETEQGVRFQFTGNVDPRVDASFERRWAMNSLPEFYIKSRFYVPSNYTHRSVGNIDITEDISDWEVGDIITSDNEPGLPGYGVVDFITGNSVYLRFMTYSIYDGVWTGTVLNTTRSQSRTSIRRPIEAANNKFLALWCDKYSSDDGDGVTPPQAPRITFELSPDDVGGSDVRFLWTHDGGTVGTPLPGGVGSRTSPYAPLISSADAGTWIDYIVYVKMASAGSNNGIIEMLVKREGETTFTKILEVLTADIAPTEASDFLSFSGGYLWGYANSGFAQTTNIYVSEFELHSSSPI